ncbi:MAG: AsmA-like C-terminal region-containing protein [Candidatus Omnitrophica bacterium]|nr:AsmA-like C-terminal region-containing protein [Candidatus Omnitrophota bacterium]MDD5352019.1 AsmA-like C-terminal region-containing protein [Candidatus Omnitrophota bacterium]MDD5551073.1 AsmA-like C-terminal region-containing protein [Candidatus Omnitrophota bacterium]
MKKKIKIILFTIIILITVSSLGIYYLNSYYLPKIIKARIIQEISNKLGVAVELKDVKFNIFKGIVLSDLSIANKKDLAPILQVERITANFLILPFFQNGKILIPSINIDSPKLDIIRYEDNKLNIQELLPVQLQSGGKQSSLPFLIYKINIYDCRVDFLDKTIPSSVTQTLKLDTVKAKIDSSGVNFNLQGALIYKKQSFGLDIYGKYKFKNKELKINFNIDKLDIMPFLGYVKDLPFTINTFFINKINSECTLIGNDLTINTNMDVANVSLAKDKTSLSDASAKLKTSLTVNITNIANFDYLINADNLVADLKDPQLPGNTKIKYANLEISPNRIDINAARVEMLQTLFEIKGNLENFSDPAINLNLKSRMDIPVAKDFIKNYYDFVNSVTAEGKAALDINVSKLTGEKDFKFQGSLGLENASLKAENIPYQINAINGPLNFDQQSISWTNLSFNLLDINFSSKAKITNFKSPSINLELTSDKINIATKINTIKENTYSIDSLNLGYYNSNLALNGNVQIKNPDDYEVDLKIQSQFDMEDLKQIKYLPQENISLIKPEGICDITGKIQGNIKNPKLLNASLNLTSSRLKLYGLSLNNLEMQLAQENQQIKIPQANCVFYDGAISANGLIDLEKENNPYAFNVATDNIDLSKLKLDTPMKDKEFEGILTAAVILSGPLTSLQDIKGNGSFLIKNGYLWEFNPLAKLGDFLFIPRYQTLVFKEAKADFNIGGRKISTDNLVLNSNVISLSCDGSIDFAGNLDFEVAPYPVNQNATEGSQQTAENTQSSNQYQGIFSEEMAKLAGISVVQVKGTIQNPKVEIKMVTKEIFNKVTEGIKGTLKKVKGVADLIFGGQDQE